jgi:hypothetical protein
MMTGDGITVLLLEIQFGGNVMGMKPNWNMCALFLKILLNNSVHHAAIQLFIIHFLVEAAQNL